MSRESGSIEVNKQMMREQKDNVAVLKQNKQRMWQYWSRINRECGCNGVERTENMSRMNRKCYIGV